MKTRFILLIALLFISSCTFDHEAVGRKDSDTVTIEEAMRSLDVFLSHQSQFSNETRAAAKKPHKILTVTSSDINSVTRSSSGEASEPLVYVVNYENDGGYAILAADKALPDPVIAVTEKGNLNSDLSLSRNSLSMQNGAAEEFSSFIKSMIVNYIEREKSSGRGEGDGGGEGGGHGGESGGGDDTGDNPAGDDPNTNHPGGPANPLYNVAPLFPNRWHQYDPFNTRCIDSSGDTVETGCLPLAVSMSLTCYYDHIQASYVNGTYYDFSEMANYYFPNGLYDLGLTDQAQYYTSLFVFNNGMSIGANYTSFFNWPTMNATKNYLIDLGFSEATLHTGYDLDNVKTMLTHNKPVIISGFPSYVAIKGHAWIIDGIMEYWSFSAISLVHCNWGYSGVGNGYYASGVFTPTQGPVQTDGYESSHSLDKDYNVRIKHITY